jgi:SRSO17 transposase
MNIYRHQFVSHCPNNDKPIIYALSIETDGVIQVEHIVTAAALHKRAYHEAIADDLHARFGGKQVMTAHHHGVDIETVRP